VACGAGAAFSKCTVSVFLWWIDLFEIMQLLEALFY